MLRKSWDCVEVNLLSNKTNPEFDFNLLPVTCCVTKYLPKPPQKIARTTTWVPAHLKSTVDSIVKQSTPTCQSLQILANQTLKSRWRSCNIFWLYLFPCESLVKYPLCCSQANRNCNFLLPCLISFFFSSSSAEFLVSFLTSPFCKQYFKYYIIPKYC